MSLVCPRVVLPWCSDLSLTHSCVFLYEDSWAWWVTDTFGCAFHSQVCSYVSRHVWEAGWVGAFAWSFLESWKSVRWNCRHVLCSPSSLLAWAAHMNVSITFWQLNSGQVKCVLWKCWVSLRNGQDTPCFVCNSLSGLNVSVGLHVKWRSMLLPFLTMLRNSFTQYNSITVG